MESKVKELLEIVDGLDEPLRRSFQSMHSDYPEATLERFLKARDEDVTKTGKMLVDCLNWRVNNKIDNILAKPILPKEKFDLIRQTQLIGFCGFCKQGGRFDVLSTFRRPRRCALGSVFPTDDGRPVFAIGVGNSTFDQASVDKYVQSHIQINEYRDRIMLPEISKRKGRYIGTCVKILDMTGLRLSAFSRLKISTAAIATVDDLNYPEKTDTYYIVNAPYVFSACWKAVKPMLQDRTKRKVQVLRGNGRDELLHVIFCFRSRYREGCSNDACDRIPSVLTLIWDLLNNVSLGYTDIDWLCWSVMVLETLPSFCKTNNGSSDNDLKRDVFSPNHKFHVELYEHIEISSGSTLNSLSSEGSLHINVPTLDEQDQHSETVEVVHALETVYPALEAAQNSSDQNQRDNLTTKMAGIQVST